MWYGILGVGMGAGVGRLRASPCQEDVRGIAVGAMVTPHLDEGLNRSSVLFCRLDSGR